MESQIVGKIRGLSKTSRTLVHARVFTHALKGRPREMRTVNLVKVTQGLLGTFFKRT